MHKIKFSHDYYKFPSAKNISLLSQVVITDKSELSDSFIEYDTLFRNWTKNPKTPLPDGMYELPKGKLILLLLIANEGKGWLWTTIRRWTPEKEKYYRSIQGQNVEIVIEETK